MACNGFGIGSIGGCKGLHAGQGRKPLSTAAVTASGAHPGLQTGPAGPARGGTPEAAFLAARRHTRRVRFLKRLLPALAVSITLVFAAWSWFVTPGKVSIDVASSGFVDGKLIMASPKLDGYTRDNLPYSMTASRAIQEPGNMDRFELEDIVASLPLTRDQLADVSARTGFYDNTTRQLNIDSPISIVTSDGLRASLTDAVIDVGTGSLETQEPVDIRLDGSSITADSLQVKENGKALVFERNVRMTLDPAQLRERRAADAARKE